MVDEADKVEGEEEDEEALEEGWRPGGQHEDEAELRKFITMQEVTEEMIHGWQVIKIAKGAARAAHDMGQYRA